MRKSIKTEKLEAIELSDEDFWSGGWKFFVIGETLQVEKFSKEWKYKSYKSEKSKTDKYNNENE